MPLTAGTILGPYEVIAAIGAGGMGEIYKATDTRLKRTVAIKVMPPHFADDPDMRQRFEREARTIAALSHPNICMLHDLGRNQTRERALGRSIISSWSISKARRPPIDWRVRRVASVRNPR